MKFIFITGLLLVGMMSIPNSSELKNSPIQKEVTVEERTLPTNLNQNSDTKEQPSIKTPSISEKEVEPSLEKELVLLKDSTELKDRELDLNFPLLSENKSWLVEISFELISVENLVGFDEPALTIKVDDHLVYQQSFLESGEGRIRFNPYLFSKFPQKLSLWSGNRGDNLGDSYTVIKSINIVDQGSPSFIEIEPINEVEISRDNEGFLTLEFYSPQTNDKNLNRALSYEVRSFSKIITQQNWDQAELVEVIFPKLFSPQSPGSKEVVLIRVPPSSSYLAIRSFDSTGELSPLGKNIDLSDLDY